ncbi:MAG: hypothetical protein KGI25_07250 [Thaumarchaeota archaeon]|nr:hypothetical protein [Nitrososphaerota archaeon]
MTQFGQKPPLDEMRRFIEERLEPIGKMPDKSRLNYNQVLEMYSGLLAEEMMFREFVQIAILKNQTNAMKNLYN